MEQVDSGETRCYASKHVADDRLRVLLRRPLGPAARVSPSATIPTIRPWAEPATSRAAGAQFLRARTRPAVHFPFSWRRTQMSPQPKRIPIDWWAVIAALGVAVLVKLHLAPHIPWW